MRYCRNCGEEVEENQKYCFNCGSPLYKDEYADGGSYTKKLVNSMAIWGFVLSFLIPILGVVFGIIGYNKTKTGEYSGRSLAIAAIIIGIVTMIANVIIALISESYGISLWDLIMNILYGESDDGGTAITFIGELL